MGIILGILNGFLTSIEHRNIRKAAKVDTLFINFFRFLAATIVLGILLSIFSTWSKPSTVQTIIIITSILIETVVMFSYVKSFQYADQSLVGPLFGLSIIFLIPFGFFFLNEAVTALGLFGILFVLAGTFKISWSAGLSNFSSILKGSHQKYGVAYMLLAAFSASIAVTLAKYAFTQGMHPLNFGFAVMFGLLVIHFPYFIMRFSWSKLPEPAVLFAALFFSGGQFFHYTGLNLLNAAYYIPLKRSSILFDVVVGVMSGKEKNFSTKATSASLIFIGITLIALTVNVI